MKYISIENQQKIENLLMDENVDLIVQKIIHDYAEQSIDNAQKIINYITTVTDQIISNMDKQFSHAKQSANMLLIQTKMDKNEVSSYFATMVPVCKTLFPDGYPKNGNLAEREYFNKFISLLKNKKAFDWNDHSDISWAKQYDYYDYLTVIKEKYIDREDIVEGE